jgi:malate dehydrogenase (oxaloacetate-decarboxylating)(NADP+)
VIRVCQLIAPTFGGINLEDIRAPECFEIEETLQKTLDIPVFHDDQHGTAIISAAALLNALEITGRRIEEARVVVSGAGAASIACMKLYKDLGVRPEHILMTDSRGVIYAGRKEGMNRYKEEFALETDRRTLADALVGADVFVGLSMAGLVNKEMIQSMNDRPIVFAMANPDPEITPPEVKAARSDAICATGRSDYPNQVNNVLGFPFIFRGALDVRASAINEAMKVAAVHALAELAHRGDAVPDVVKRAYPGEAFDFGPEYIIPKPFDPRVLLYVPPAVAQAAMETGVARRPVDIREYEQRLQHMIGDITNF